MCGIYGVLSLNGARPERSWIEAMGRTMSHRGPNDLGVHGDGELMFGMHRLSIIDIGGGHQPIANEDGTIWLVCNGEIYNFRELREVLKGCGHQFKTDSDSEVIIHAYEEYGEKFLKHIDGMFGFALWDSNTRKLTVSRDRLGIKPFYYYLDDHYFAFASELKSLLKLPFIDNVMCPMAVEEYLGLGYVPAPLSMIKNIKKLLPATQATLQQGRVQFDSYWQIPRAMESRSEADWQSTVRSGIEEAVKSQMVSDVPLGAFLSGGIDSSAVVAFMAKHSSQPVKTYSIGFEGSAADNFYNELPYARQVAELFATDHREIIVKPDVVQLLPKLLWYLDEPIADSAFITTYLVSEFAKQDVTVILSGVGGDELYGGYRRYLGEHYAALYERIPKLLRNNVLLPIAKRLPSDRHSSLLNLARLAKGFVLSHEGGFADRYRSYVEVFGDTDRKNLLKASVTTEFDALDRAFEAANSDDALQQLLVIDSMTQLPDDLLMLTDRMSMAVSLECRVPLLDTKLVEQAAVMPGNFKIRGQELKYILKKSLADTLPKEILYRKKRGFGAPMGAWIRDELATLMAGVLSQQAVEARGLFHWPAVSEALTLHSERKEDLTDHLISLLNLELWSRLFIDGVSPEDLQQEIAEHA